MSDLHASFHRWLPRLATGALFAAIGVLPVAGTPAQAALGGDSSTVTQDQQALNGTDVTTTTATYTVTPATGTGRAGRSSLMITSTYNIMTTTTNAGTMVNEYVSATGVVFAITWSGPQIPDLQQLLGGSFSTYANANATQAAANPGNRGRASVSTDDLVINSNGHMRGFQGLAYLKSQLPSGFNINSIR